MISKLRQLGARRAITAILALGLVGVVAVPVIDAASSAISSTAAVNDSTGAGPGIGTGAGSGQVDEAALTPAAVRLGALLKRVVRGDLTVRAKGGAYIQVHYERGQITAVSAMSITVKGPDSQGATYAVTASTRVRSQGKLESIGDLSVGQNALILGTGANGSYTAVLIRGLVARPATTGTAPAPAGSTTP